MLLSPTVAVTEARLQRRGWMDEDGPDGRSEGRSDGSLVAGGEEQSGKKSAY